MTCSVCISFYAGKTVGGGFGREAWIKGCTRLRSEVVHEHEASKMHRDASAARQTSQSVQKIGGLFAKQFAQRDETVVMAMKLLFWICKENVALSKWNALKRLVDSLGVEDITRLHLSRNASYSSHVAREDMLEALYSVVKEETADILSNATFCCIMSDESTDVSNIGQLVMHLRCVKDGVIHTRFGGLVALGERNAAAIQRAMEEKATEWEVDWRKCHLASDGASVFTGRVNGVIARLVREHDMQHSISVHCICHREALAAADAVKAVPYLEKKFAPTLGSVYRQFDNSSVKEAGLHEFQAQLDLPVLCLKEPKAVRWLSYDAAITAFRRSYKAIVMELDYEVSVLHDPAAKGLLKNIRCYEFVASLHLFSDAVPILTKLSKKFQAAQLNFAHLQPALDAAITSIQSLKDEPGAFFGQTEDFIERLRSDNEEEDIVIPVSEDQRMSFNLNVRKAYLQAVIDCLRQRFPSMPVISALQIFDSRNLPAKEAIGTYGNANLDILLDKLAGFVDAEEARSEWLGLKAAMITHPALRQAGNVSALLQELCKNHQGDYPNLIKIGDWGLAIALSTADAERDFSLLNLVKSARRNRLSSETLQKIMIISSDADQMDKFPFEKAMASWHQARLRRTTTAKPTEREKTEAASSSAGSSAGVASSQPSSGGDADFLQTVAQFMHLESMPKELASQLHSWAQSQQRAQD